MDKEAIQNQIEKEHQEVLEKKKDLEGKLEWLQKDDTDIKKAEIRKDFLHVPEFFVDKMNMSTGDKYSLWIGASLVFLVDQIIISNDPSLFSSKIDLQYILAENKKTPFRVYREAGFFYVEDILRSMALYGLKKGDFCNIRGHILQGRNREYSQEIFDKVFNGIEILPNPELSRGYREIGEKSAEHETPSTEIRTTGLKLIESLNPDQKIQGTILGSGSSYTAYVFGDKVIVEADETERATYFFSLDQFESLRKKSRGELLRIKPSGFKGRVIHYTEGVENWERKVKQFLRES